MSDCKTFYAKKVASDKAETACLKVNRKILDKNNQPYVKWHIESSEDSQGPANSGPLTVFNNDTVRLVSKSLDINVQEGSVIVSIEKKKDDEFSYTTVQLFSNNSCLVPKNFHLNQIQSILVNSKEEVEVEILVDDSLVKTITLAPKYTEENNRTLYMDFVGIALTKGQILEIRSKVNADFILYFCNILEPPFASIVKQVSITLDSDVLFYPSNLGGILDDIFD